MVFLRPKSAFDVIVAEGVSAWECLFNLTIMYTYVFLGSYVVNDNLSTSLLSALIDLAQFVGFVLFFHLLVVHVFKGPSTFREVLCLFSYTTIVLILKALFDIIHVFFVVAGLCSIELELAMNLVASILSILWQIVLIYFASRAYYHMDIKQTIITIFMTAVFVMFVIIVIALAYLFYVGVLSL